MSDLDVITACENLCRDFSWLPDLIADLAPMIALAGAIVLFFLQRRTDRKAAKDANRLQAYSNFLAVCEKHFILYRHGSDSEDNERLADIYAREAQLELLGPKPVAERCASATAALVDLLMADEHRTTTISSDGQTRTIMQNYFFEMRKLKEVMNKEVNGWSSV